MRLVTKTLVSVTAVIGIAAGTLATAGTSVAAPETGTSSIAAAEPVTTLAVVNLGLSTREAECEQKWLKQYWGYTGEIDGALGTNSWKAEQRFLRANWDYNGEIDGIAGAGTQAAFERQANWLCDIYGM
ncbi:hypothetical protein BN159_0392 [Streptomyces davaonensis JCM 4913]|uniref:Secreted protein n=1 Tax=Streptomyces davaonensis (strain DSM 101723 / JCM 4913 / KCC S-0913 / 768) TaxID=1214101 RepID=K4QSJ7_STRDJ|nr:hypothetical protein [Streptomyces davaonensis]CCK24771.1 hypothetical protein BN159_0392 [Streptomyces davaonensis JCM 4913]